MFEAKKMEAALPATHHKYQTRRTHYEFQTSSKVLFVLGWLVSGAYFARGVWLISQIDPQYQDPGPTVWCALFELSCLAFFSWLIWRSFPAGQSEDS